ncbi:MAG: hypothetical protein U5R06_03125 [candidate division KSB1 bacterium]|nr:hypothetical protein [candidate division KSB1 bacterium]
MIQDSLTKENKQQALNRVLNSEEFINAAKYQELLKYLVSISDQTDLVKECTIAIEFFGKDTSFDPAIDSSVRAYISNLRKKLEHYYLTQGADDPVHITLPKGHYHIEFVSKTRTPPRFNIKYYIPYIILGIFLLVAVPYLIIINHPETKNTSKIIPRTHPVWQTIFQSPKKTLIVLGDYYFFSLAYEKGRQSYIRDVEINSDSELAAFIQTHPEYKNRIDHTYHSYLDEHLPQCVSYLVPSLVVHGNNFEIKLSSELQIEDLQNYNIVYIGPYKCLNILDTVTRKLRFNYQLRQGSSQLLFYDVDSTKEYSYNWVTNPETNARNDYVMVIKVSGYNDNTFVFFISEHDFGNIGTMKYFTDPETAESLQDITGDHYFEALFEVTGIIRTAFKVDVKHINFLHSDFEIDLQNDQHQVSSKQP